MISQIRHAWRLPGCGDRCRRDAHNPFDHEFYGRLLEREGQRHRVVRTGPLVVDLDRCTATVHGRGVALTPREWELLAYYAERPGRWCTAAEIVAEIWTFAAAATATTARWRLRQRLGEAASLIETQQADAQRGHSPRTRLAMVEVVP